ncbi:MAG: hypothetical protein J2P26_04845 [Nocardiopsaceae bacterium]|nr:hypothetical protein [Nocardiopsaceae bacterium]
MGCNCGGHRSTTASTGEQTGGTVYRHTRPDGQIHDYLTPGEAQAARDVAGGSVTTVTK